MWEAFEREEQRSRAPDCAEAARMVELLYEEARSLGVFPLRDPLEGIEVDIRLARALNVP